MRRELRFCGVGGQGVLLAGEILAEANIYNGGYGVKASTYTSQVRGGPTKVDILLDTKYISYPYANEGNIEFMLSTAQVSFNLFKSGIKEGSFVVIDPDLVQPSSEDTKKFKIIQIPIIDIAKNKVGNVLTQSVVALGISVAITKCTDRDLVFDTMVKKIPKKMQELNKKAFCIGEECAQMAIQGL